MTFVSSETVLTRALAYLNAAGIQTNREIELEVLHLVEEALADPEVDTMRFVMETLPYRIATHRLKVFPAVPPIHRSSIGYPNA
ncbi:MAG: hypothetical protein ACU843_13095 [Gammaproteobacteria bacterium]